MARIESFEDFDAYIAARAYVKKVYTLTRIKPLAADFVLRDQMRGALESILSNFAEGFGRQGRKEFIQFLSYANGSLAESRAKLHVMVDQEYLTPAEHESLQKEAVSVGSQIGGLMRYLGQTEIAGSKYQRPGGDSTNLKPKTSNFKPRSAKGAAIISVLLVLTVLTIMVVAFLQSMRIDRLTARAYLNKTKADFAADAAFEKASQKLVSRLNDTTSGGTAFTTWAYFPNAGSNTYYTAITSGHPDATNPATPYLSPSNTAWLFSDRVNLALGTNSPADPDQILSTDLNLNPNGRFFEFSDTVRVPWQECSRITEKSQVRVLRFAYWIDDESSRLDLSVIGNTNGTAESHLRNLGIDVTEINPGIVSASTASKIIKAKSLLQTPISASQLDTADTELQELKQKSLLLTTFSHGYDTIQYAPAFTTGNDKNRAYRGKQKLNLNDANLVDSSISPDTRVATLSDWIQFGATDYFQKAAPNYFSAGFLADTQPTIRREMINTLSASIIDYMDADNTPTQPATLPDPTNLTNPAPPVKLLSAVARPAYFGADRCPRLNEFMTVWNRSSGPFTASSTVTKSGSGPYTYTIPVTRRFELWNMSKESIPAANYKARFYYQQQIEASSFGFGADPVPDNSEEVVDLGQLTFLPNEIKVVEVVKNYTTTGPNNINTWNSIAFGANGVSGGSDDQPANHNWAACVIFNSDTGKWLSVSGYLGGDEGMTDGVTSTGPGNAGASKGNRINDPRMDPLRSYSMDATNASVADRDWSGNKSNSSYGSWNNASGYHYQAFNLWMDRPHMNVAPAIATPLEAISTVPNQIMSSPAELGNVFDPSWSHPRGRGADTNTNDYFAYRNTLNTPFRGGGSLRVGQPDMQQYWAANSWILLDLFSTSSDTSLPKTDAKWRGKLNINIPKYADGTNALQYAFQLPSLLDASPSNKGTAMDANIIVSDIKSRLTKSGTVTDWKHAQPFYSVGELSQLSTWQKPTLYSPTETQVTYPAGGTGTQITMLSRSDRGREEIYRRSHNLLTTKGNSFRIYIIGQYCQAPVSDPNKLTVLATSYVEMSVFYKETFDPETGLLLRIEPEILYKKEL